MGVDEGLVLLVIGAILAARSPRSRRRRPVCPFWSRSWCSACSSARRPGGIEFDDAELAREVGIVGLALILFEAGRRRPGAPSARSPDRPRS